MIALLALAVILTAALAAVYAYKAARWYRRQVQVAGAAWADREYQPKMELLNRQLRQQTSDYGAELHRLRRLLAEAEPQMRWATEARSSFPMFARVFDRLQHADAEHLETLVDELTTTLDTIDVASLAGYTVTMADPRPPVLEGTGS